MRILITLAIFLLLQACKHPLAIEGEGDIVERLAGDRGCTLGEFQAESPRCSDNQVVEEDYIVSYEAIPRPGWVFTGWEGTGCSTITAEGFCEYGLARGWVDFTDMTWPGFAFPATTAVFKPPEEAAAELFEEEVADQVLGARCLACHVEGGLSGATRLVFDDHGGEDQNATNVAVFREFIETVPDGKEIVLNKIRGGLGHGGGSIFSSGSSEFASLANYLTLLSGETTNEPGPSVDTFWDGTGMISARSTLRRAGVIVAGRIPTEEEYDLSEQGDNGLRQALRNLMEGELFHAFLIRNANDRLHTDAFLGGLRFDALAGWLPIWLNLKADLEEIGGEDAAFEYYIEYAYGMTRAPLELIAHVVENDLPYSEVLTAKYTMVNPESAEVLRSEVDFDTDNLNEFHPGLHRGQIFDSEALIVDNDTARVLQHGGFFENYPHAGVLNTLAFLNRYPSTETNRNRARARWTYYHFLGVNIEQSASRSTDSEALADTNNPTLNNPACTVCHELMDPVAGSFQNYGDEGWYRNNSRDGVDALPDTYKHPEQFEENPEPTLYQVGDTWYRDMRTPGFNGQITPNADNSLQWLAQQIVADPRFARATIQFWWPALMGEELAEAPEVVQDVDFSQRLEKFEAQQADVTKLADGFRAGSNGGAPLNLKDLLVEMMMSHWFRAISSSRTSVVDRKTELRGAGGRRLLTPEELDHKTRNLLGYGWHSPGEDWESIPHLQRGSQLHGPFRIYYGGIDSSGVLDRSRQMGPLMGNIALKQSLAMACSAVILGFDPEEESTTLFSGLGRLTTPLTYAHNTFEVTASAPSVVGEYSVAADIPAGDHLLVLSVANSSGWDEYVVLEKIEIRDDAGALVHVFDLEDVNAIDGLQINRAHSSDEVGGPWWNEQTDAFGGWQFIENGTMTIPFSLQSAGSHTASIFAWNRPNGEAIPLLDITVENQDALASTPGQARLKQQLVVLHARLLGERLPGDDPEIDASYQLLVDSWLARKEDNILNPFEREGEQCEFHYAGHAQSREFGEVHPTVDPRFMMGAWTSLLIYLMTDYRYLHE